MLQQREHAVADEVGGGDVAGSQQEADCADCLVVAELCAVCILRGHECADQVIARRFPTVPGDADEFIPYPQETRTP